VLKQFQWGAAAPVTSRRASSMPKGWPHCGLCLDGYSQKRQRPVLQRFRNHLICRFKDPTMENMAGRTKRA
jgi:hypothetical protein